MPTYLLDGNTLVALCLDGHEQHELVHCWLAGHGDRFATCSVTQGTLLRMHMRLAIDDSVAAAWETLRRVSEHPRHEYWPGDLSYLVVPHRHLQGSKQVTDAWLAELARRKGGKLATLDHALTALHDDVAEPVKS